MMRRGQVAVYLALAILAIAVMIFMNVDFFLAVRSKNRMMNAVDAAAIVAARHQGEILNEIGRLNIEHLECAINGRIWPKASEDRQQYLISEAPKEALDKISVAAASWGCTDVSVDAGFVERDDLWKMEPLTTIGFYDAIGSKAWCWFSLGSRRQYLDVSPKSILSNRTQVDLDNVGNCEYFSVHVRLQSWANSHWYDYGTHAMSGAWTNFIKWVVSRKNLHVEEKINWQYLTDDSIPWAFYDASWERKWSATFSKEKDFPINGSVKPIYDVAGCSAQCRIRGEFEVTAEAKPLGTVIDMNDEETTVTEFGSFIMSSNEEPSDDRIFKEAQLVVFGSVPHSNALSTQREWYQHVTEHLDSGNFVGGCWYCQQLQYWESASNRQAAREWLSNNDCTIKGNGPEEKGGYDCAH